MKKYIIFTFFIILSLFLFCGCSKKEKELNDLETIKKRGHIIVGVKTDSPPFGFYKDKKLSGVDIDIANEIAQNIFKSNSMGLVKFVAVNPQNRISKLNSKEVDILVATMSINEKRKLILDFSAPYFIANQKIMIRKTSKISSLQYFNKNGRLAVILGTTGEKISRLVVPNAHIIGAKSYVEAYNLLVNKQVDAILGDDCILAGFKNNDLRIINKAYSREYYAVAVRKSEKSKELLNAINAAIVQISDEKRLNLIKKRWIIN
ncbi:MAG: transporter substrate-binding domain-containing protein [Candidatus Gastranaerophilales bacterium]|nr:transporter substrate-binding domain-containing protein [Candidatus Gastranaerophilales bacterium]